MQTTTESMTDRIKLGWTRVKVWIRTDKGPELLHNGTVVGITTTMLRVFGTIDADPNKSEWFAISSPMVWCELDSTTTQKPS